MHEPPSYNTGTTLFLEVGVRQVEDDETALHRYLDSVSNVSVEHMAVLMAAAACPDHPVPNRQRPVMTAEQLDTAADDEVARHLEGLYWLVQAENVFGDPNVALSHCERGLRLAEQQQLDGIVQQFATASSLLRLHHSAADGAEAADPRDQRQRDDARRKLDGLSGRELQTALLVSEGCTNEQIARKLELSPKTVETYLARIFKKLVITCRAEIAAIVGRAGR